MKGRGVTCVFFFGGHLCLFFWGRLCLFCWFGSNSLERKDVSSCCKQRCLSKYGHKHTLRSYLGHFSICNLLPMALVVLVTPLRLQVCKQYLLWGLKSINGTYFGPFGVLGFFPVRINPKLYALSPKPSNPSVLPSS